MFCLAHNKKSAHIAPAALALLIFAAAAMCALLLMPQADAAAGQAKFIFAGTHDDADCAILISENSCMVIDTGEEQDGGHILSLLRENGVESIDCLILTHPDKDHIGGAPLLLDSLPVGRVIVPRYTQVNARYEELCAQMDSLGTEVVALTRAMSFEAGGFQVDIYPPQNGEYKGENNNSLITYVKHGEIGALFMGDAKRKRLDELDPGSFAQPDIYKAPYHGRDFSAGVQWISALRPRYAIVTAAAPEAETAAAFKQAGSSVLCTKSLHDVVFISDGKELRLDGAA